MLGCLLKVFARSGGLGDGKVWVCLVLVRGYCLGTHICICDCIKCLLLYLNFVCVTMSKCRGSEGRGRLSGYKEVMADSTSLDNKTSREKNGRRRRKKENKNMRKSRKNREKKPIMELAKIASEEREREKEGRRTRTRENIGVDQDC